LGDHTKALMQAAKNNDQLWIRVDGPYGKWPFNFFRYKCAVLVAGGVGVTPSIATIRHIYNLHRQETNEVNPHLSDLFFIWSCKSEEELAWYKADIEAALERSALNSNKYPTLHVRSCSCYSSNSHILASLACHFSKRC
jgi:predicted ferric reductase